MLSPELQVTGHEMRLNVEIRHDVINAKGSLFLRV